MSNISSNSLFHFTSNLNSLTGILENNFVPRYCLEETLLNENLDRSRIVGAIPMVCFCDISLGQINNHIKMYGSYGIGMSKEWGMKKKLNPLIYINQNSKLADSISEMATSIYNLLDNSCNSDSINAWDTFFKISNFLKPYTGNFFRNGNIINNVRFYNEREWRFIPEINFDKDSIGFLSKEDFKNDEIRELKNKLLGHYPLKFTPKDIKYIFVKNENEIHNMIKSIRDIKGTRFSPITIDILASKIVTTKQILEDF